MFVIPDPEYINLKQELESALRDAGPLPKETKRGHDRFIIRGRRVLMKQELKSIQHPNWLNDMVNIKQDNHL